MANVERGRLLEYELRAVLKLALRARTLALRPPRARASTPETPVTAVGP